MEEEEGEKGTRQKGDKEEKKQRGREGREEQDSHAGIAEQENLCAATTNTRDRENPGRDLRRKPVPS